MNKKIVLISCASSKLGIPVRARDMYVSTLFKFSLQYAQNLNPDKIFILSAKYGLLDLNQVIDDYNITLNEFSKKQKLKWSENIIKSLKDVSDLEKDEFIILAGSNYYKEIIKHIINYKLPLGKLKIGQRMQFLKKLNQRGKTQNE